MNFKALCFAWQSIENPFFKRQIMILSYGLPRQNSRAFFSLTMTRGALITRSQNLILPPIVRVATALACSVAYLAVFAYGVSLPKALDETSLFVVEFD